LGSNLKYVYPVFGGINLGFIRIGGPGLGNLLYPYFRAIIYAKENNLQIIDPVFRSIKVKLLFKNQKRTYNYKLNNTITGFKRILILTKSKEEEFQNINSEIKVFKGFHNGFKSFYGYENFLFSNLTSIYNKSEINVEKFKNSICCHIRLGDFKISTKEITNNTRIPISWYKEVIQTLRKKNGVLKVFIFSDGNVSELSEILMMDNTEIESSNEPIHDIVKMSSSKFFIGSYSSFSMWASYFSKGISVWNKEVFNKDEFPTNNERIIL
jgi:hypothetical protein